MSTSPQAAAGLTDAPGGTADGLGLRRWFAAYILWMLLLTVVALGGLMRYEGGESAAGSIWLLALALFYVSLCCAFFPAPTTWIVMLLASNEMKIVEDPVLRVLVVSIACSVATGIANLNEYHVITFLLRHRRIARVRDTRVYRWAARWFARAPFLVVTVFGFVPLPVDVVRWLAILYRYSRLRYFAAYVVGRFPRYVLLAAPAVWLDLNWWQITLIQAALALVAIVAVVHSVVRKRRAAPADLAPRSPIP